MAWQTPKTDWDINPTNPVPADFNRIEGNIDFLNTDIETKKGAIVDAINTMGRSVTIANTHAELAVAIKDISDDANAGVADVLQGKTFYQGGAKKTGTIPSKSAATITPGTTNQVLTPGQYLSGAQTILGDVDLIPANIKKDINIFGVTGALPENIFAPSDDVIMELSGSVSSTARSYTKVAEFTNRINGSIRLRFILSVTFAGQTGRCKVYNNGVAKSTEFTTNSTSGINCTVDLDVKAGDLIQFYVYIPEYAVNVKNVSLNGKLNGSALPQSLTII